MNKNMRKHKVTGRLYEIQYAVHTKQADGQDVYACYLLSAYDGMPVGNLVFIRAGELE